ncbi:MULTISPECIES: pilus assembly protein TadG-related protein [unclassified Streptomyces]|uniref:pilus assembly protein TadG-related protein n=1 Tax=unclassified Streptomyces TaxID=2593676 RepID=UPI0014890DF9|nr:MULTISPECIES: pilus assembly protein TadG-related protein [unclassified Streptomyces]
MTRPSRYDDTGQAFPIYITVVAGLLFLAFAYLAVGQAGATRNEAQTAADAAALAAAQDLRDQLGDQWLENVLDPDSWPGIFDGNVGAANSCWRADQLAAQNDARVTGCDRELLGYTVDIETTEPVGDTIVPGTEDMHAAATATAVIEPRCTFELPGEDAGDDVLPTLNCKDRDWNLDPEDLDILPEPEELFDVHLAESQANDE